MEKDETGREITPEHSPPAPQQNTTEQSAAEKLHLHKVSETKRISDASLWSALLQQLRKVFKG